MTLPLQSMFRLCPVASFAVFAIVNITTASAAGVDLMGGREGGGYQLQLPGSGGIPPYKWEVVKGNLPPGLELARDTGLLTGKFAKRGEYPFTVRLTDARDQHVDNEITLRVSPPLAEFTPLDISTTNLPPAMRDKPYNLRIATRGGIAPITCSVTGELPKGLKFDAKNCGIEGTPSEKIAASLTIVAQDSQEVPVKVSRTLEFAVDSPGIRSWWIVLATIGVILVLVFVWGAYETMYPKCPSCQNKRRKTRLKRMGGEDYYCPFERKTIHIKGPTWYEEPAQ